jgi:hypothetical protein
MKKYLLSIVFLLAGLYSDKGWAQTTPVTNPSTLTGADSTRRPITTAVPFLTITPDARAGAMGDAGVATSPDANSAYWNPAKLARIDNVYGVSLSYTPWLGKIINDMSITYLSGYYKFDKQQAVAMSMKYFNLGEIFFTDDNNQDLGRFNPREFAFDATYSRILTDYLSLGLSGRFIHSNLTGNFSSPSTEARPGNAVGADIGVFYDKPILKAGNDSRLAFGAVITNIGSKLTYSDEESRDFIPTNFRVGSAYTTYLDPYNKLTFALDFNKLMVPTPPVYEVDDNNNIVTGPDGRPVIAKGKDPNRSLLSGMFGSFSDAPDGFREEMKEISLSMGVEYWYNDTFAARMGYFHEHLDKGNRKYLTFGLGFRYQQFGVDFAYLVPRQQEHPLAETLRFSLFMTFSKDTTYLDSVRD